MPPPHDCIRNLTLILRSLRPPNHPIAKFPVIRPIATRSVYHHLTRRPTRPLKPLQPLRSPAAYRSLSTESKENLKYSIKLGLYWTAISWTVLLGGSIAWWLIRQDLLDRQHPSPSEWRFFVKAYWRAAKDELETEGHGRGMVDWTLVGTKFRIVVGLLEDYKFFIHRPSGCTLQNEVYDPTLPFAADPSLFTPPPPPPNEGHDLWPSRLGYDITMQSEAWRRGYFEAMLGMAKSAEMRDGYMTHNTNRISYAPQHIRSEANPFPVPLPPGAGDHETPDIADCKPTLEPAGFYYRRLLTTKGFTRQQRMQAGIAYGSWLDHQGDSDLADSMYRWSLHLAAEGLPEHHPANTIIDTKTGIIKPNAPYITPNIVSATSAFARHFTQTDRIPEALAIYVSILRARRHSPDAPPSRQYPPQAPDINLLSLDGWVKWITSLPHAPEFSPRPPTGDEAFERRRSDECEEAALELYVAEILFARMGRRREGLAWTRTATEAVEERQKDKRLNEKAKKTCEQCLHTGLQNWTNMVGQLAREQRETEGASEDGDDNRAVSKSESWFWRGLGRVGIARSADQGLLHEQDWAEEEKQLRYRLIDFEESLLSAKLNTMIAGNSNWFVV